MHKDRTILPAFGRASLAIVSSFFALASGVQAQSPQRGPQSIEIAGVRLGMPREEAIKALMANQPPLEVEERGITQFKVPVLSPDPFVWSMKFRAKPSEVRDTPTETMELDFPPPPSGSAVLTLRRYTSFNSEAKARAPTGDNFLDAIKNRFGPNASNSNRGEGSGGRNQSRTYVWTRTGELLTDQEYQRRWKHYNLICDVTIGSARTDNGINFRVFEGGLGRKDVIDSCAAVAIVSWRQDQNGVIDSFSITMTDAAAILAAFTKSAEVAEGAANQQRKQELDRARERATKNPTKL